MTAFLLAIAMCWGALTGITWFMESATLFPRGALAAWIASLLLAPTIATLVAGAAAVTVRRGPSAMIAEGGRRAFAWGLLIGALGCALAAVVIVLIGDRPVTWAAPSGAAALVAGVALTVSPRADPLACPRCGYDLRLSPGIAPCPECGHPSRDRKIAVRPAG